MNLLSVDCDWVRTDRHLFDFLSIMFKKLKETKKIIFMKTHHHILNYIDKDYHIFNIDHHHDFGYGDGAKNFEEKNEVGCGNWVYAGIRMNLFNRYTWISNYDSENKWDEVDHRAALLEVYENLTDIKLLEDVPFEKIVVVESSSFPYTQSHLPYEILRIFCDRNKIHHEIFNPKNIHRGYKYAKPSKL